MKYFFYPLALLLIMSFTSLKAQNGIIEFNYPDGSTESLLSYVDDIYEGTSYWFYPNGNIKLEKTFSLGKLNGWVKYYYETGLVKEEFYLKGGIKDGLHKEYYSNGALKSVRSYDLGILKRKVSLDFDEYYRASLEDYNAGNRQYALQNKKEELICDVEICPIPIGGLRSIQDSLVYPEHAMLYGLEGIVTLIATVNERGEIEKTEIIHGLELGCEDAASLAVKKNKFLPGQQDGKPVQAHVTLNIEFWLNEDSKREYKRQIGAPPVVAEQSEGLVSQPIESEPVVSEAREEVAEIKMPEPEKVIPDNKSRKTQPRKIGASQNFNCSLDDCPFPIGGLQSILDNLEIPEIAKRVGLRGEVIIIATVDENGFVRETELIKGMGHGCSDAAEVALYNTQFYPGKINGKAVKADVEIVIPFSGE